MVSLGGRVGGELESLHGYGICFWSNGNVLEEKLHNVVNMLNATGYSCKRLSWHYVNFASVKRS